MIKTGKIILNDSTTGSPKEYELGIGLDPIYKDVPGLVVPISDPVLTATVLDDKIVIEETKCDNKLPKTAPRITTTVVDYGKDWQHVLRIEV